MDKTLAGLMLLLVVWAMPLDAAIDAYPFPNEELQQRYDALIDELRCPQCLNTNLAGSDAMIAQDLRREVHRMLLEGRSDDDILSFMHERYGDFILYNPRVGMNTWLLWFGPFLFLLVAGFVLYRIVSRSHGAAIMTESGLSEEEAARIEALLNKSDNT
jgi:cytochrome c-type biogenesis protein CcmH